MKKLAAIMVVSLSFLCGCAHQYVIRTNTGSQILTASKPKLKDGVFHYKDANGVEHGVSQGRVIEIVPASMAKQESKVKVEQPQKSHWWKFW
jgi:hypothetical protein